MCNCASTDDYSDTASLWMYRPDSQKGFQLHNSIDFHFDKYRQIERLFTLVNEIQSFLVNTIIIISAHFITTYSAYSTCKEVSDSKVPKETFNSTKITIFCISFDLSRRISQQEGACQGRRRVQHVRERLQPFHRAHQHCRHVLHLPPTQVWTARVGTAGRRRRQSWALSGFFHFFNNKKNDLSHFLSS